MCLLIYENRLSSVPKTRYFIILLRLVTYKLKIFLTFLNS